jgi:cellulose synthase/poly-beta-1,6-N-acetylglucosamine synthase-like glycosyltransferase
VVYAGRMMRLAVSLGALVWPPLLWAAYLRAWPEHPFLVVELTAFGVAMLPGVVALCWLLPLKWWTKAAMIIFYILLMGLLLFGMSLSSACERFGGCL